MGVTSDPVCPTVVTATRHSLISSPQTYHKKNRLTYRKKRDNTCPMSFSGQVYAYVCIAFDSSAVSESISQINSIISVILQEAATFYDARWVVSTVVIPSCDRRSQGKKHRKSILRRVVQMSFFSIQSYVEQVNSVFLV